MVMAIHRSRLVGLNTLHGGEVRSLAKTAADIVVIACIDELALECDIVEADIDIAEALG